MFPSLMCPKPTRRIAQDTFFHQTGILFGNPVFGRLFGSLGHQFHIYGIVAAFHLLRIEEYDRQIQFSGKAFGAGQDGGILVQEVRPIVQVVSARCLVGDKDHDTAGFVFLQGDDIAHSILFFDSEGAEFRSHIDGSKHIFTPEKVMDIERTIGADIMMAFDECPPGDSDYEYAKKSLGLTHRWLDRCIQRFNETEPKYGYNQALFPIVQGCVYPDLRKQSAEFIASKGADGNAIGGLAVGEPVDKMYEMIEIVNEILPKDKPRYLMGVGTPVNILEGIERGVDMFDCVMPTRNGRNGMLFTKDGIINMRNKKWETDFSPIEADGASSVDTLYSKAYLRHLFHAQELLAMQIASIHNLAFYLWLAGEARKHIIAGDFSTWKPMMVKRVSTRL